MVDSIGVKPLTGERSVLRVAAPISPAAVPEPVRDAASAVDTPAAAAQLSNTAQSLAAAPPVDLERVAMIKKAIANGSFPILPATIADRLLALSLQWNPNDKA